MTNLNLSGHTILLVDDEEYTRGLVASFLSKMGQPEIHTAEDGDQALKIIQSLNTLSFIISDFKMPNFDGLQLLHQVRTGKSNVDRAVSFAMLTGYAEKPLVESAVRLDVNAFLIKPVSKDALGTRIKNMLEAGQDRSWLKSELEYQDVVVSQSKPSQPVMPSDNKGVSETEATVQFPDETTNKKSIKIQRNQRITRRLSGLTGKFTDSDLAKQILDGVGRLMNEIGDDEALEIVSALDRFETNEILNFTEIESMLSASGEKFSDDDLAGGSSPPQPSLLVGDKPDIKNSFDRQEEFYSLGVIPEGAELCRDINTVDNRVFIKSGIIVSPLISTILARLDTVGVLDLDSEGEDGTSGIYVYSSPAQETGPVRQVSGPEKLAATTSNNTRLINTSDLSAGNILADNLYTSDGRLYLQAGAVISERLTSLLQDLCELGTVSSTTVRIVD